MVDFTTQGSTEAPGIHLVLYDGVCGLCDRLVQLLLAHDRRAAFAFAPIQSDTGRAIVERAGGNPDESSSFYVLANYRTPGARVITKSRAALFVASELGWPWRLTLVMRAVPSRILDLAYDVVARHRYRVFGRYERCLMPRPEFRRRFVE